MRFGIGGLIAYSTCVGSIGCASIAITQPPNGAPAVVMPQPVLVTEQGLVQFGDVSLDSFNMSQINGAHRQYVPQSTLYYASPGKHVLHVVATNFKLGTDISDSSSFTVTSCPLCYVCPTGTAHPVDGQCCTGGNCDSFGYANFGPRFFSDVKCSQAIAPGSTELFSDRDCIGPQTAALRGPTAGAAEMSAVSFTPNQTGALAQIQVPIGVTSGTPGVQVWITTDAAGKPGTVLETIAVSNVRPQPPLSVVAPVHIFSAAHPTLTFGTTYWLVIGPADPTTFVQWNKALSDFSIPNTTTYLVSTTTTNPGGPWAMKSNLVEPRPAFEIDVH